MSGNSLLIDTNIALYLLNRDTTIANLLNGRDIHISFITELELLGFQGIRKEDISFINDLLDSCIIVDLNQAIKRATINLKQNYNIKLPDAIIAATGKSTPRKPTVIGRASLNPQLTGNVYETNATSGVFQK